MKPLGCAVLLIASSGFAVMAADTGHPSIAKMQDGLLSQAEREVVSLAEAMPADKYDFAPTQGEFKGVRTFGMQMSHIAAVLHEFSANILGESGTQTGENENGPASLKSKEEIVKYLNDAFAHAHRAANSLTAENFNEVLNLPWAKMTKGGLAEFSVAHTFDHYGQAVVYARMNGIIPPASRKQ
jgi:uncharacterized damage-inducible protein DinB